MYISLDWIDELVNLETIKLEDLIDKLTLGGFEVEEILELEINKQKRIVLDISATANRADSLSLKGIAKEITSLIDKPFINSEYTNQNFDYKNNIEKTLFNSEKSINYSSFIAITLENLTDFTIPTWLTEKLLCSGVEPLNNFLDFQNYILLETGYPFEFYDLKKIQDNVKSKDFDLTLKPGKKNDTFLASNDINYNLTSDILVIDANGYPLSIAGIISNKTISYTNQTNSLLIEGSIFNSKKIRQQSRIVGLRTDRSARYEKGLNNSYFTEALLKLIALFKITNPKLICKIHTTSETVKPEPRKIILKYENIIEILGPVLDSQKTTPKNLVPTQITEYLNRLDFTFTFNDKQSIWTVEVPIARIDDLEREIDLIEEIGRLHGFNNFVTNLPNIDRIGTEDFSYQTRKKITTCFLNEGFNELIQYSLVNEQNTESIKLVNPLITDCSMLRTSLLPNLVKIISENVKQGNSSLEGFEYGHVFSGDINSKYLEKEKISGIFGGAKFKREWNDKAKSLSWFEAKGKIEKIFKKLNVQTSWKISNLETYQHLLHPYRTAELFLESGISLGIFGQIHPILAKNNNVSTELFLFEFDLELLKDELQRIKLPLYEQYGLYPKITKDLSFIIGQDISFDQIQTTIIKNGTKFLKNIELLDEYRGNSIPENKTSLCIQLTFQSMEKTLVTKEVEEIVSQLQLVLEKEYEITSRI